MEGVHALDLKVALNKVVWAKALNVIGYFLALSLRISQRGTSVN